MQKTAFALVVPRGSLWLVRLIMDGEAHPVWRRYKRNEVSRPEQALARAVRHLGENARVIWQPSLLCLPERGRYLHGDG